jgi:peptide-methionine (S)-S-oxide reductase
MPNIQSVILGGGCFWCTETLFKRLRGVVKVVPGYAGGHSPDPTYEQVCTGNTGHAEVIKIDFDSEQISFETLLDVFFSVHDPTTPNRQGNDMGTQYRSIILFSDLEQEKTAQAKIARLTDEGIYRDQIVTELKPLKKFYEAEEYHHDYFAKNPDKAYCQLVINPKLKKLKDKWKDLIK